MHGLAPVETCPKRFGLRNASDLFWCTPCTMRLLCPCFATSKASRLKTGSFAPHGVTKPRESCKQAMIEKPWTAAVKIHHIMPNVAGKLQNYKRCSPWALGTSKPLSANPWHVWSFSPAAWAILGHCFLVAHLDESQPTWFHQVAKTLGK